MALRHVQALGGHEGDVLCVESSVKGLAAEVDRCLLSGSEDGSARLWDVREGGYGSSCCFWAPGKEEVGTC